MIVGNGPSLRGFDFARIANVDCIGMNAAYRFWHETGWYPRYYICLDLVVGLSHKDAIADLIRTSKSNGIELFFLRQNLIQALPEDVQTSESVVDFDAWVKNAPVLAINPLTTGSHSALIGALLGYDRLILLGIDCDYVEQVSGAKLDGRALEIATTPESNPNYFFDGYQVAGDRYNVPNPQPDLHIRSWRAVAPYLKDTGVRVWNCNPVSLVDAFDFRRFEDIEDTLGERLPRPAAPGLPHGRKTGPAHGGAAADLDVPGVGLGLGGRPLPQEWDFCFRPTVCVVDRLRRPCLGPRDSEHIPCPCPTGRTGVRTQAGHQVCHREHVRHSRRRRNAGHAGIGRLLQGVGSRKGTEIARRAPGYAGHLRR